MPTEYCGEGAEQETNGIYYYSWTGNRLLTNIWDISDAIMFATGQAIDEPNDGLVPACSTHIGKVLRDDYRMKLINCLVPTAAGIPIHR